jgi:sulfur-oxidizing protein SoxY
LRIGKKHSGLSADHADPRSCAGRRSFLAAASAIAAAAALPSRAIAQAARTPLNNMPDVLRKLTGSAQINKGKVKLGLPPLVENGHLVPLTVSVESPMTAAEHVKAIHVLTEKNPLPETISFQLGPRAGRANVATRVRLADTQTVIAIAELSDGSFWSDSAHVIVTLAACLEEL